MKRQIFMVFFIFGIFLVSSAKDINIGIIQGKTFEKSKDQLGKDLKIELDKNFENTEFNPLIKKEVVVDQKDIRKAISNLEKDENIDAIFVLNQNPFELLMKDESFKKLVIAPFFYGIYNFEEIKNLNTISTDYNLKEVIDTLDEIKKTKTIGIVFSEEFLETAKTYEKEIKQDRSLGEKNVNLIPLNKEENFSSLISNSDALMILSESSDSLKKIMEKSIEKKIPSFSFLLSEGDNSNILMGYTQKDDRGRRLRVASINLLKFYEKKEFSELISTLDSSSLNIMVDYKVAEATDLYIQDFSSEKINIIHKNPSGNLNLTISDALVKLLNNNTSIKSKKEEVTSGSYDIKIAKSSAKPNLSATMDYQKNDGTRAMNDPTSAENSLKGGFTLSQVLYDEGVFSNVTIQKKLYNAVKEGLRQEEVSRIHELLTVYLNTLKSYSSFEIEEYNNKLIKKYLSVAKTKYALGSSGPEDIYRFESELASSMTNLEEIRSNILSGNSELNELLNMSMDNYFSINEKGIEEIIDLSLFENYGKELEKPWKIKDTKNYFIQKGIEKSSELKSLDFKIEAKERELKTAKRKRFLPIITADVNYDKDLRDPWGEGSSNTKSDQYWTAGVGFTLPIYSGGEIGYTKNQVESELKKLKFDRESKVSSISKDISSQYAKVLANYRKIKSAKKSVEASRKNLKLQEDLYVKGKISITDIIDARNNFIVAEQTVTSVKFDYYISMVDMESLCGKYYFEYSNNEKKKTEVLFKSLTGSDQEGK